VDVVRAGGLEYLALATELLQRQRVSDAVGGLWEAADVQWWFTRDPHPDAGDAVFWLDGGVPVAATVFTRWSATRYGCDVLGPADLGPAWDAVRERCAELAAAGAAIEMAVRPAAAERAREHGFTADTEDYWVNWLDTEERARPRAVPDGYAIVPRPAQGGVPHPMIGRNGEHVEGRLRDCSLYDPQCDLAITAPDGSVAGYALFWPDPRTGVGLVEPMRIMDAHSGRGLGGALLREGMQRLADRGCRRLKVTYEATNKAAQALYRGAGFIPSEKVATYVREPASAG
jgi:ribosomal protein S18 acetylase RimI-like enzyme